MFANSLRYQFAVFFDQSEASGDVSLDDAAKLGDIVAAPLADSSSDGLFLKLRAPVLGQMVVFGPTGGEKVDGFSWATASGVWNMAWTPTRLDLFCDAAIYHEVANKQISVTAATERVAANLEMVSNALKTNAIRVALVVTGEDFDPAAQPLRVAARLLGSREVESEAERIPDFLFRVNRTTTVEVAGLRMLINRLETVNVVQPPMGPPPTRSRFVWQMDCSTDAQAVDPLPPGAIRGFLGVLATEIEAQLAKLRNYAASN